mgnify:CR=1 FL=1
MRALSLLLAAALLAPAASSAAEHDLLPAGAPAVGADSIYLLGGAWEDHEGRPFRLEELRGKPVLISMFYATCPHACPMLITDLKRVERALPAHLRDQVQVVLVTFDPARDTAEKLKALLEAHQVDAKRWRMLRTDPAKVQELAAVLGIKYRFTSKGAINHSTVITLLDREGAIAARLEGLRQPEAPLVEKLVALR